VQNFSHLENRVFQDIGVKHTGNILLKFSCLKLLCGWGPSKITQVHYVLWKVLGSGHCTQQCAWEDFAQAWSGKPRLEGEAKRSERVISEYPSYKIEVKRGEYNPFTTK
jgi:hypothetical protein